MKKIPILIPTSLGFAALLSVANLASAQETPPPATLFYDFNSSDGATLESSGTAQMDLEMYRYSATQEGPTPHNLLAGSLEVAGKSGLPGDRALNLTLATGMGAGETNFGGGAVGSGLSTISAFDGAQSLTIAGWFYATGSSIRNTTDIINAYAYKSTGFRLEGNGTGLYLTIMGENVGVNEGRGRYYSDAVYGAVGEWVFFAATFDNSGAGAAEVNFFIGGVDTPVTAASATLVDGDIGNLNAGDRPLTVGNISADATFDGTERPFDGYLDDLGIWGSADDGSGALTLEQLEGYRQQQTIPEPSTAAYLFGALAGVLVCCKRRLKK